MMHRYEEVLLDLLASSINNPQDDCHLSLLLEDDEWIKLIKVAKYHGVASIVADRVEHFPKEELPGKQVV